MRYPEYMGLDALKLRKAIGFIASRRHFYSDADSRLAFLACELARKVIQ